MLFSDGSTCNLLQAGGEVLKSLGAWFRGVCVCVCIVCAVEGVRLPSALLQRGLIDSFPIVSYVHACTPVQTCTCTHTEHTCMHSHIQLHRHNFTNPLMLSVQFDE